MLLANESTRSVQPPLLTQKKRRNIVVKKTKLCHCCGESHGMDDFVMEEDFFLYMQALSPSAFFYVVKNGVRQAHWHNWCVNCDCECKKVA